MNEKEYDKFLNIDTEGYQIGYPKSIQYHRYEPTPYKGLEQLFEYYTLLEEACVIDVGCGKGRVPIYIADRFRIPTKGIEMDPKFFAAAEQNLTQYKKKRGKKQSITFIQDIAENYSVEQTDNTFFFFNPFSVNIFRTMLQTIKESYVKHVRTIHFIFYYPSPEYISMLTSDEQLRFVKEIRIEGEKNRNERFVIYALEKLY